MLKRIGPVTMLAAAFLLMGVLFAAPVRATDDVTSNYQSARTREVPGVPGDRMDPVATPAPGDDDMPNRTVRRQGGLPHTGAVNSDREDSAVHRTWVLTLWQKFILFGSKVVFFVKA